MKAQWAYFKYVVRHKWYVGIECMKAGIPIRGIVHDWTKLMPCEWGPYVERFYGKSNSVAEAMQDVAYQRAWNHHQKRNDHHWQYWMLNRDDGTTLVLPMSEKARKEMVADWRGMGRMFGTSTLDWYLKNRHTMTLHEETRHWVEMELAKEEWYGEGMS